MWVVYDHPKDFPHCFVARRWSGETPTGDVIVSPDLEQVRWVLEMRGLVCLKRMDDDVPQIVETWL